MSLTIENYRGSQTQNDQAQQQCPDQVFELDLEDISQVAQQKLYGIDSSILDDEFLNFKGLIEKDHAVIELKLANIDLKGVFFT